MSRAPSPCHAFLMNSRVNIFQGTDMRVLRVINGLLLAGGLALGLAGYAGAGTLCVIGHCDYVRPDASVLNPPPITIPVSAITPTILQPPAPYGAGQWGYGFTVVYGPLDLTQIKLPNIAGWELELVQAPMTWTVSVDATSDAGPAGAFVWTARTDLPHPFGPGFQRMGFSLQSPYEPTEVSISLLDAAGTLYIRKVFLPLTPEALAAGYTSAIAAVPEPSGVLLFAVGAAVVALGRRNI